MKDGDGVQDAPAAKGTPREVAAYFARLGFTAFGGPAAHIAMMRQDLVVRRKWVTDARFLDLIGATNLVPGPNSTEMAIHLGFIRAGWRGLVLGGACFILPAVGMVLALAWAYDEFGSRPQAEWLLYGIKPVIIAIVAWALWALVRAAVRDVPSAAIGVAAVALYAAGVNELVLLAAGAGAMLVLRQGARLRSRSAPIVLALPPLPALAVAGATAYSGATLFLTFLKIGSVLFGSGYVLLAFLRADFVERLGWLTEQQLLDAVAIGQFTPGPLFTTATFVGYLVGGWPGAALATAGIFLPAFVFVAVSGPIVPRLRGWPLTAAVLDGVVVASLALMAVVTWQLAEAAVADMYSGVLAAVAFAVVWRFRALNSAWLVLAGAAAGAVVRGAGWV
jgi:chromate transporter